MTMRSDTTPMEGCGTQEESVLSLDNVGMYYWLRGSVFRPKRFWALRNITFELNRGDSLGVIGRNGSGKTTLLSVMAGVMSPDEGHVSNRGATISLLSLSLGFLGYLTGRQNAVLSGMLLGMPREEMESKLEAVQEFSGLGYFFDEPLSSYSSGMGARLAFATAFQIDPDVLLIDEVTGVGDIEFKERSFNAMTERVQSSENTIVFVSHHPVQLRRMCNRLVWIEKGRVAMQGDTAEVLDAYEAALAPGAPED